MLASLFWQAELPLPVTVATDHEPLQRGHIYVAPADHHLLVLDDTIMSAAARVKTWPARRLIRRRGQLA